MGGLKGRGARHTISATGGRATLIDESYNANPASMRATLTQLGQTPASRRIAVLGTMGELGEFSTRFHEQLLDPILDAHVDYAVLVGDAMEPLVRKMGTTPSGGLGNAPAFAHCAGPAEAITALEELGLNAGDAILVKGSNFVGLGRLVDHFVSRG